jgi:hypothetical protein
MKKFITTLFGFFAAFSLFAQGESSLVQSMAANTVSNYLSGKYIIDSIRIVNTSTNNATIKFYDWATASTNVERAAYTTVSSYSTNYSVVYTNSAGLLGTNTYKGWYTANATVAAVTNEQSRLGEFQVTASTTRDLPFNPVVVRGLTVLSSQAGTIEVVYSSIP